MSEFAILGTLEEFCLGWDGMEELSCARRHLDYFFVPAVREIMDGLRGVIPHFHHCFWQFEKALNSSVRID